MVYDTGNFPLRVVQDSDGVYRWKYLMNPRRNKHAISVVGKVFLAMGGISAVVLRVIGSPNPTTTSDWTMPLMVLGMFLGIFLLVTGLLYLQGDDPLPYAMDEEQVTTFVGKNKGPHSFSRMRKVRFMPQHDAIRLGFGLTIYVPAEDFDTVKAFLLEHLPPDVNVR